MRARRVKNSTRDEEDDNRCYEWYHLKAFATNLGFVNNEGSKVVAAQPTQIVEMR